MRKRMSPHHSAESWSWSCPLRVVILQLRSTMMPCFSFDRCLATASTRAAEQPFKVTYSSLLPVHTSSSGRPPWRPSACAAWHSQAPRVGAAGTAG